MGDAPATAQPGELLLDHQSPQGAIVKRVRGTLLAASLKVVKDENLFESYMRELPREYEEAILYSVASSWLPVEVALVHYQTLDRLRVTDAAIERNASRVGARLGTTFMGNMVRVGQSAGIKPSGWGVLKHVDRVWDRVFEGGGCRVIRVGPKDALIEFCGIALAQCRYYRVAHVANVRGISQLFSSTNYVRSVRSRDQNPLTLAVSISWV